MAATDTVNNAHTVGPDDLIKPALTLDGAKELVGKLYGYNVEGVKQLDSYDDQNFYIAAKLPNSDKVEEFTLKVMNNNDSKNVTLLDAQTQAMLFLNERGFSCPKPVKLPSGEFMSLEKITTDKGTFEHMVRLLSYIPGQLYKEAAMTPDLCYQAGRHIATVDMALKDLHHKGFHRPEFIWTLQNFPSIEKYVYVFEEEWKRDLIHSVVKAFKVHVEPNYDNMTKGVIHGDYNEGNILIMPKEINSNIISGGQESNRASSTNYEICGLLDYGDMSDGYAVFEVAISLAYTMLMSDDPIQSGGHMLAGYLSAFPLSTLERALVYYCIAARISQSVVLGMYTFTLHPENKYLLNTQKSGWILLEKLWSTPKEKVEQEWSNIIQTYSDQ